MSRRSFAWSLLFAFLGLMSIASPAADQPRILVHGHRGARARRPENTMPAFQYAIEQGVDALEMDMAVTRDNIISGGHPDSYHD